MHSFSPVRAFISVTRAATAPLGLARAPLYAAYQGSVKVIYSTLQGRSLALALWWYMEQQDITAPAMQHGRLELGQRQTKGMGEFLVQSA